MDLYPKKCNICGYKVIFTSNSVIYGKEYGSGKCYICTHCGAYVGTHIPRPKQALGVLADAEMRKLKIECHDIFDSFWKGKPKQRKKRKDLYWWLSKEMGIDIDDCHFGYFGKEELKKAKAILDSVKNSKMIYDNCGNIHFENVEL